jgi:ionotropic glutamate receptor
LIPYWEKQFEPNTKPCYEDKRNDNKNKHQRQQRQQRLSLANLMGAFAVLAFGCLFSLLVFLAEMAISHLKINNIIVV